MIEIITAKTGKPIAVIDGVYLLSKYDPLREVQRFIQSCEPADSYILFGTALGYLPQELIKKGVNQADIIAYEPSVELRKIAEETCRSIVWIDDTTPLSPLLEQALIAHKRPSMLAMPAYRKIFGNQLKHFSRRFASELQQAVENLKVTAYFSRVWFLNFIRNLTLSLYRNNWNYLEINTKLPANLVIAAAGPSLDKLLDEIGRHRQNFVLISVISAANTLITAGILPNMVIVSDAGAANSLYGLNLPPDIPILASVYSSSALLSHVPNSVIFYDLKGQLEQPSLDTAYPSVTLETGLLAQKLVSGAIVFCGFDLAYNPHRSHSRHNALYELRRHTNTDRLHPMPGILTGFMRRNDLTVVDNRITHPQFRMIREVAESLFQGTYYVGDGLEFQKITRLNSLGDLPLKHLNINLSDVAHAINDNPDLKHRINQTLSRLRNSLAERQTDLISRVFTRQVLAGNQTDGIIRHTLDKIDRLMTYGVCK